MGGTCLNRGCIPSKLLIHSADIAEIIRHAGSFGINVQNFSVDFSSPQVAGVGVTEQQLKSIYP